MDQSCSRYHQIPTKTLKVIKGERTDGLTDWRRVIQYPPSATSLRRGTITTCHFRLKASGLPVRFCTNETQCTTEQIVAKLSKLGFSMAVNEVFAPAPAVVKILKERNLRPHLLVHPGNYPQHSIEIICLVASIWVFVCVSVCLFDLNIWDDRQSTLTLLTLRL